MNQDYVTASMFSAAMEKIDGKFSSIDQKFSSIDQKFSSIDQRFGELKNLMMEGFGMLDKKIDIVEENLSSKIDELMMTKADREEVFALHKRIAKIEKKIA